MPQTYNYHPIIPPSDEENPSGPNVAENGGGGGLPRDCAICMLPVDTSGTGPPGLHVLGRAQYMLTPCQHLFHTECLEKVNPGIREKVSCVAFFILIIFVSFSLIVDADQAGMSCVSVLSPSIMIIS